MTVLVGIKCRNGIVIGSDSSATFSNGPMPTIEQEIKKVSVIGEKVILAGTGSVGLNQRFASELEAMNTSNRISNQSAVKVTTAMSIAGVANFKSTGLNQGNFNYGALVAFATGEELNLCEFDPGGFQPELKTDALWYASMGSGQGIADPFLGFIRKIFWRGGMPSLEDGILMTAWTIQQAIDLNAGGINGPIQMAVLQLHGRNSKATLIEADALLEHSQNIVNLEEHIRVYRESMSGVAGNAQDLPTL